METWTPQADLHRLVPFVARGLCSHCSPPSPGRSKPLCRRKTRDTNSLASSFAPVEIQQLRRRDSWVLCRLSFNLSTQSQAFTPQPHNLPPAEHWPSLQRPVQGAHSSWGMSHPAERWRATGWSQHCRRLKGGEKGSARLDTKAGLLLLGPSYALKLL